MISFDIFGTLLYRACGTPEQVFMLMREPMRTAKKISFPTDFSEEFADIRAFCAIKARERKHNEANFDEIYAYMKEYFGLSEEQISYLQTLEFQVEKRVLKPIMHNVELFESFVASVQQVMIISDMYYSATQLRELLEIAIGHRAFEIPVIVSCEYDKTKRSGELYSAVRDQFQLDVKTWTHYGDDSVADIKVPSDMGISVVRVSDMPRTSSLIEQLRKSRKTAAQFSTEMAARCGCKTPGEEIGAALAGPLLYSFVYWIVNQAVQDGVEHLFFLARDGYILKEIAMPLVEALKLPLVCHYMEISRVSVLAATYFDLSEERIWDYVSVGVPHVTLSEIASRLLLEDVELIELLKVYGRTYRSDDIINVENVKQIRLAIHEQPKIEAEIRKRSEEKRKAFLLYLDSIHFRSGHSALVDVGWNGSIQDSVYLILKEQNAPASLLGYYFGVSNYTALQNSDNRKKAFAFYPYTQLTFDSEMLRFAEMFTAANLPQTISYTKDGTVVYASSIPENNKSIISALQSGILKYTRAVIESDFCAECYDFKMYEAVFDILSDPDRETVDFLGCYQYQIGALDNFSRPMIPQTLLSFLMSGKKGILWHAGCYRKYFFVYRILRFGYSVLKKLKRSLFP